MTLEELFSALEECAIMHTPNYGYYDVKKAKMIITKHYNDVFKNQENVNVTSEKIICSEHDYVHHIGNWSKCSRCGLIAPTSQTSKV